MRATLTNQRPIAALLFGLAVVFGLTTATPAEAQSRYRVLVPMLEPKGDVDDDFGEDVAEILRERLDDMDTHAPVEEDAFDDALDQFDLDEDDLDCVRSRQLASHIGAQLVMCGSYTAGPGDQVEVTAQFMSTGTDDSFPVPPFTATSPEEATEHIITPFEQYVQQIRSTAICSEYLGSQQWENALRNCNIALSINSDATEARYSKGRALMEMDSLEQALTEFQTVLDKNSMHEDALKTAGIVAARLDRNDLARDYFGQYLEMNPGDADVRLAVAMDLAQAGDPEGALGFIREGISQDSSNLTLIEYAGHFALNAAKNRTDVQGAGEENASDDGEDGESVDARATELFEEALTFYRTVFAEKGKESEPTMLRNMLAALNELERYDEASELGSEIVAVKSDDARVWSTYATSLRRAGRLDEALAALDSVQAIDASYGRVNFRSGRWLMEADRGDEAQEAFQAAVDNNEVPSDAVARSIFGIAYNSKYQGGDLAEAGDAFAVAAEFATEEQTSAMISFWRGYVLYQQGKAIQEAGSVESAEESLPVFERALQFLQQAGPYAEAQQSINLNEIVGATQQYIDIQKALIERG